jgi:hypothetical protein
MRTRFDMAFGAVAALVMDYAAVAFIFGLLVLDRWLRVRRGITLDSLFVLIAGLSVAAWFAGSRLNQRLARNAKGDDAKLR